MFNIEYKKYGPIVVAIVYSNQVVDSTLVQDFGDEIVKFFEDRPHSHLLLNFSKVDFMSSAMLTELLRINDTVRRQRGSMRICGLRKQMREIFTITKLDNMFHIEDDCKACLKTFHGEVTNAK